MKRKMWKSANEMKMWQTKTTSQFMRFQNAIVLEENKTKENDRQQPESKPKTMNFDVQLIWMTMIVIV